ncbi:hypothetical protein E2C01_068022 [Portunus trituberculatus]|uniref:Uncharacterized protein n=1 Tax=Portunus trituberculatus TaxID=210409 RepID=A0A5B7HVF6_PORTR|nr:hypothetical protein [Portunus trituberculatus]
MLSTYDASNIMLIDLSRPQLSAPGQPRRLGARAGAPTPRCSVTIAVLVAITIIDKRVVYL